MARGGYRGGSSLIGWSSQGYRDSLKPRVRRAASPVVLAKMQRLDRAAAKAQAARDEVLGRATPLPKPKAKPGKARPTLIKRVKLGGLTEEERIKIRSHGRMRRVVVEKKNS